MKLRRATIRTFEPTFTNRVSFDFCGEHITKHTQPIEEACRKCTFWKGKFTSPRSCQKKQKRNAELRDFVKLVCPRQFLD